MTIINFICSLELYCSYTISYEEKNPKASNIKYFKILKTVKITMKR